VYVVWDEQAKPQAFQDRLWRALATLGVQKKTLVPESVKQMPGRSQTPEFLRAEYVTQDTRYFINFFPPTMSDQKSLQVAIIFTVGLSDESDPEKRTQINEKHKENVLKLMDYSLATLVIGENAKRARANSPHPRETSAAKPK
jgi:hypothetical protein